MHEEYFFILITFPHAKKYGKMKYMKRKCMLNKYAQHDQIVVERTPFEVRLRFFPPLKPDVLSYL